MDKSFLKKFFCKGVQFYFEISLLSFTHKIFEQNFYLYITVYLVRIWTYKNADEKAHTFSRRSKNVKKRTKTYEKRILCKFTFSFVFIHSVKCLRYTFYLLMHLLALATHLLKNLVCPCYPVYYVFARLAKCF